MLLTMNHQTRLDVTCHWSPIKVQTGFRSGNSPGQVQQLYIEHTCSLLNIPITAESLLSLECIISMQPSQIIPSNHRLHPAGKWRHWSSWVVCHVVNRAAINCSFRSYKTNYFSSRIHGMYQQIRLILKSFLCPPFEPLFPPWTKCPFEHQWQDLVWTFLPVLQGTFTVTLLQLADLLVEWFEQERTISESVE